MTDVAEVNGAANNVDVSDAQLEKYFTSKGEEMGAPEEEEVQSEPEDNNAEPLEGDTNESDVDNESDTDQELDEEDAEPKKGPNAKYALQREKQKRQELQKQLEEQKVQYTQMQQQVQQYNQYLQQMQQQAQQQQEEIPNPDVDPIGYLSWQQTKMQEILANQNQYLTQQQQLQQQNVKKTQFKQEYKRDADTFAKQTPDFYEAYNFAVQAKVQEYLTFGYSEAEAHRLLEEDETAAVIKARQAGANPAQKMYEFAKSRGYKPKSMQSTEKLQNIQKGINASKTLAGSGKVSATKGLNMDNIDSLSPGEIDELFNQIKTESGHRKADWL